MSICYRQTESHNLIITLSNLLLSLIVVGKG